MLDSQSDVIVFCICKVALNGRSNVHGNDFCIMRNATYALVIIGLSRNNASNPRSMRMYGVCRQRRLRDRIPRIIKVKVCLQIGNSPNTRIKNGHRNGTVALRLIPRIGNAQVIKIPLVAYIDIGGITALARRLTTILIARTRRLNQFNMNNVFQRIRLGSNEFARKTLRIECLNPQLSCIC